MSYTNSSRTKFLQSFEGRASLDSPGSDLPDRCKFNFSYYVEQEHSQSYENWHADNLLTTLLEKITEFSKKPLSYWKQQGTFNIYTAFPHNSLLTQPKSVPHQAIWAAFRLQKSVRLIGFIIPAEYDGKPHQNAKGRFDCNVFYVVFLDKDHKFYPMDIKNNQN